jgi:hypothetical protein
MTQEYRINYHTGAGNETINTDDIATVMDKADEGAAYTQENISITDENGNLVAIRRWYGVAYNPDTDEESNPIIFGTFGYYSDWQDA